MCAIKHELPGGYAIGMGVKECPVKLKFFCDLIEAYIPDTLMHTLRMHRKT